MADEAPRQRPPPDVYSCCRRGARLNVAALMLTGLIAASVAKLRWSHVVPVHRTEASVLCPLSVHIEDK